MKKILLSLLICLVGCANPAYYRQNLQFTPRNWLRIAVIPFTGDERFTQVATDTFNLHLLEQHDFIILEPVTIQYALDKIAIGSNSVNEISILQAQQVGQIVNAEGVFIGNISSCNNGITLNAFATVKLVDTKTGEIIAVSHKPSGLFMAFSEHQCAVKAVERAAKDMIKALKGLSTKNISEPVSNPIKQFKENEKSLY